MDVKHILLPVDYSDFSQAANEYASVLAKSYGAKITYLHVSQPDTAYGIGVYVDGGNQEARDELLQENIQPTVEGIEFSREVEFGLPSIQIVEYATEHGVDLIVMGTHGRTGFRRAIMGSVAEAVVRKSECPVLALKSDLWAPHSVS